MCSSLLSYVCDLHCNAIFTARLLMCSSLLPYVVIFTARLLMCSSLPPYVRHLHCKAIYVFLTAALCDLHYKAIDVFFTAALCM